MTTLLCPADRKRLLQEIRTRLAEGKPCRVVSTSLIEAGVDVDFPTAWRKEPDWTLFYRLQGRCNREGKRPVAESLVTIFQLEDQQPPAMLHPNLESTDYVLRHFTDPASPKAIEAYFFFFRRLKGDAALDQQNILRAFKKESMGVFCPLHRYPKNFIL